MTRTPCGTCFWRNRSPAPCGDCIMSPMFPKYIDEKDAETLLSGTELTGKTAETIIVDELEAPAAEPDRYPDDNPKTRFGLAKPPIALIPGPALIQTAEAMRDGARKYGPANWREKPVTTSTYTSAAMRHLLAWIDGEENAPDSGVHHLGHVMGCIAILIDAQAQGTLNDDRPTPGRSGQLLSDLTRPMD